MVAGLLMITALRVGLRAALGALSDLRWGLASVAVLQLAVPLVLYALCWALDLHQTPAGMVLVLATAAPAISGSPALAILLGQDAGRMMQILVLGTAAFPLTVLPVLALLPQLGEPSQVIAAALRLLAVIVVSCGVGFALRRLAFPKPTPAQLQALDGLSVLAFSVIVVGLMAALGPALHSDPVAVAGWALLAFVISYGLQIATCLILRPTRLGHVGGPLAIGAGNRNIALFLVALPEPVLAPLMVFVGCWQLPMYLTPILLRRLYRMEGVDDPIA